MRAIPILIAVSIGSFIILAYNTEFMSLDKSLYQYQQLFSYFIDNSTGEIEQDSPEEVPTTTAAPFMSSLNSSDVCIHPQVDIFDPEIMKFYPKKNLNCNGFPRNLTYLQDRQLVNNNPDTDCFGRCLNYKSPKENSEGKWILSSDKHSFDCEVVEARCTKKGTPMEPGKYFNMHTQLIERELPEPNVTVLGKQYSVYFITIDSHAYTQQFRNFPKSNEYLTNEMDAVLFPYLNRASDGSRENAVVWWYGKLSTKIDRSTYGLPSIDPEPGWQKDVNCKRGLDNETFLLDEFEKYGYVTNLAEDWWRAIDYACKAISKPLAQHHYLPYTLAYEKYPKLRGFISQKLCIQRHEALLDYFSQFVQAYKDKPKMGWSWIVHVGHNNEWESQRLDPYLLDFLKKNKEELDNSFLFIGGDHGMRFTGAVKTKIGKLDVNNPLLLMTLPKELRKNKELLQLVKDNAKELQTHFDTRATLLDILKFQPAVNFHGREQMDIPGEMGHSFLRKQPKPRSCKTLPIHVQSCICESSLNVNLTDKEPARAQKLGQAIIANINDKLKEHGYSEMCRTWNFTKVDQLNLVSEKPVNLDGVILAQHDSSPLKEEAQFRIFASGKDDSSIEVISLDRLDRYGSNGDCVPKSFQPICTCY